MPPEWGIDGRFSGPGVKAVASLRRNFFRSFTGAHAIEQPAGGELPPVVHGLDVVLANGVPLGSIISE